MPPTSINGTDITGATINGNEVSEITVNGNKVFTSLIPLNIDPTRTALNNLGPFDNDFYVTGYSTGGSLGDVTKMATSNFSIQTTSNAGGLYHQSTDGGLEDELYTVDHSNGSGGSVFKFDDNLNVQDSNNNNPYQLVIYGADGFVYVHGHGNGELYKMNHSLNIVDSMTHSGSIQGGTNPGRMAWGGDGHLYVPNSGEEIVKINPKDMTEVNTFSNGTVNPDTHQLVFYGNQLYQSGNQADEVIQWETSGQVRARFTTAGGCLAVADEYVYIQDRTGTVRKINPVDMSEENTLDLSSVGVIYNDRSRLGAGLWGNDDNIYYATGNDVYKVNVNLNLQADTNESVGDLHNVGWGAPEYVFNNNNVALSGSTTLSPANPNFV